LRSLGLKIRRVEGLKIMSKPATYTSKTKCCIRCKFKSDHSCQDGYEIYCAIDSVPEPDMGGIRDDLMETCWLDRHEKYRKWCEWSVPRSVKPWGSCSQFEESAEVVEHERKVEEFLREDRP